MSEFQKSFDWKVAKVDEALGVVLGYAIVCKTLDDDGNFQDYVDLQDDQITESAMLECALDFMSGDRVAKAQHEGEAIGTVVFGIPLTDEIAKGLGMSISKTGFVIGIKPESDDHLAKFASGDYTGFSIGGFIANAQSD